MVQTENTLVRIEFNSEFSNEVGYVFEKQFEDTTHLHSFLENMVVSKAAPSKEVGLEAAHLNLLRDLIENKITYLKGFSSNCSVAALQENYNYILSGSRRVLRAIFLIGHLLKKVEFTLTKQHEQREIQHSISFFSHSGEFVICSTSCNCANAPL